MDKSSYSNSVISALLAIRHSTPTIISTPSIFSSSLPTPVGQQPQQTASTANPTPNRRPITPNRRASVAIIIRIAPDSARSLPSSSSSSPKSEFQSSHLLPNDTGHDENNERAEQELSQRLRGFFRQEWVQNGRLEIFYIERATRANDRWSAHIAFPGGRMEAEDEDGLFCAMRETWEEVGIDLAEKEFIHLGRLDDREITTSLGKRLLMVLSPYVFLSTHHPSQSSDGRGFPTPTLEPAEVTAAYWVPLHSLAGPQTRWGEMTIDLSSRLAPSRGPFIKFLLRSLVGSMRFRSILLPHNPITQLNPPSSPSPPSSSSSSSQDDHITNPVHPAPDLNLWGLTLGMTLDLLSFFKSPNPSLPDQPHLFRSPSLQHLNVPPREMTLVAPSITSIFPRFTHPDINALIWLLGRRYRNLIKQCQEQQTKSIQPGQVGVEAEEERGDLQEGGSGRGTGMIGGQKMTINYMNNQISWTSLTMKEFYRSVRKALILSILFRLLSVTSIISAFSFCYGRSTIRNTRVFLRLLWSSSSKRFNRSKNFNQLINFFKNFSILS
ncbi:hypothetical protein Pst134EA_009108 [Puccinia striiformis f. sp. tritici]|uniref:Nudix hydrolase domain-containing protein n=1 Tax=Puccinia striiformis f. sp. tritici PST-78 TaxID=1165861 RepID=A0A0L0UTR9_9BASI|nr:hypothetical protein Pst134EA_009108 [Puccinia striiformis f. sp. tritici]KAH9468570.1 hypothetical protein Pst134EA_009108 [Puccinia striiformis f. sp. tritici]KAI9617739.1 hypothetical protein KEM48_007020 [Puccinia striiformis f. sp. tritici PST-130]KNE90321.1 hypothetical protein PSTG_16225 [Puccinia striiformis f. sp. tritici PST-78]